MSEPQKHKVTYSLTKETLKDRAGGYYPTLETLDRRCKDAYGSDVFYDLVQDCCARYDTPATSKQAETGRYWSFVIRR